MGNYINVRSKKGCEDLINDLWSREFKCDSWLIYSKTVILDEIAYIQSGKAPSQTHLVPYLHTVDDWNNMFPAFKEGNGQVFISAFGADIAPEEVDRLRKKVRFVLDHRFLFTKVTGLRDAKEELGMDIQFDRLDEYGKPHIDKLVTFSDLPIMPKSVVFRKCLQYSRPDLWQAYYLFIERPSQSSWEDLRDKVVPWSSIFGKTVWQICEAQAEDRDGKSYGIYGRFRDGNIPSIFEIKKALTEVYEGVQQIV